MRRKQKSKNGFPQRDSKMSNPVLTLCLAGCQASPAMRDASVVKRLLPAQRDSGNSISGKGKQVIMTVLIKNLAGCFMGGCRNEPMSKTQNVSAQRYSKMSNFGRLSVLLGQKAENSLPQRHSRMSNLDFGNIIPAKRSEQIMFTLRIKNIVCCFGRLSGLLCWPHGGRLSGSKLKVENGKFKVWEKNIKAKTVPLNDTPECLSCQKSEDRRQKSE
jgi:hypothetical protein